MKPRPDFFHALWLFIVFVSVVDGYLVLEYRWFMHLTELNPAGRALIALNEGDIWYLLAAKFIGTGVACGLLLLIQSFNRSVGLMVASGVAFLQLCLLVFLTTV
jgi:hypothetical protein